MMRSIAAAAALAICTAGAMPAAWAQGSLVPCADENGYCRVPYPTRVFYGVPGRVTALDVGRRGVRCANDVFGDPAPGHFKHCVYVARDAQAPDVGAWRLCARENGFCAFRGRRQVRYGVEGRFVDGVFVNGVACNNQTFGDPAPFRPKVCFILD